MAESSVDGAKLVHPEYEPGHDGVQQVMGVLPATLEQQDQALGHSPPILCAQLCSAGPPGVLTQLRCPWPCSGAKEGPDTGSPSLSSSASALPHPAKQLPGPLMGTQRRGLASNYLVFPEVLPAELPPQWGRAGSLSSMHSCMTWGPEG